MAATPVRDRRGPHIKGGPRQTGPTIAAVLCTWAVAEPLYVRVARSPEPEPVIRQSCPRQYRRGLCMRADEQERGLFHAFRLLACEIFRKRIFRHWSPLRTWIPYMLQL